MSETQKQKEAFESLASRFPARYKVRTTTYLQGLLKALAEGDSFIATQIEAVRDNLLVITASGKHLDRLASLYGIVRGQASGVQDPDFRQLVPVIGASPKQITHSLQRIIDVIYGPYASHANTTASAPAPYKILAGSQLSARVEEEEIRIQFKSTDAADPSQATAQEIATAISERTRGRIVGSVVFNARTGEEFVNIRTSTIGSQGFIQVLGGDAQSALRFPQIRNTRQEIATWNITRYLGTNEMVYTTTAGISPGLRTAGVRRGDFVTIRQDTGFGPTNVGTFEITFVEEDSFRVNNGNGVIETGITQAHKNDFVFYRPDLGNILLSARPATILQTAPKELTVLLPVTSPIVKRTLKGGHHYHGGLSAVVGVTPSSMTLASTNGFANAGSVHVLSSRATSEGVVSSVGTGVVNLISAEGWPSIGAFYSPTTNAFYYFSGKNGNQLTGVSPQPPATLSGSPVKYSERYQYTSKTANKLESVYPEPSSTLGLEVTSTIEIADGFAGSFLYDNQSGFVAAQQHTVLTGKIQQGSSRTVIDVEDVSDFPDVGHFIIEYGTKEQERPIRYLGKVGSTALLIDPGHVFERDHLAGSGVRLIRKLGPHIPRANGDDYAVYMTGTSQARSLLAQYLVDIVAAGITLKFNILVPEQKWPVLPLLHSSDPLATELATF